MGKTYILSHLKYHHQLAKLYGLNTDKLTPTQLYTLLQKNIPDIYHAFQDAIKKQNVIPFLRKQSQIVTKQQNLQNVKRIDVPLEIKDDIFQFINIQDEFVEILRDGKYSYDDVNLWIQLGADVNKPFETLIELEPHMCEILKVRKDSYVEKCKSEHIILTPLMYAIHVNDIDLVQLFIKHGANVNAVCKNRTALFYAFSHYYPNKKIIDILLKHQANPNIGQNDFGESLLHILIRRKMENIITSLIKDKLVNLNVTNLINETPLSYALGYGDINLSRFLLKNGADPNIVPKFGKIPIEMAIDTNNKELIYEMIHHGAELSMLKKEQIHKIYPELFYYFLKM